MKTKTSGIDAVQKLNKETTPTEATPIEVKRESPSVDPPADEGQSPRSDDVTMLLSGTKEVEAELQPLPDQKLISKPIHKELESMCYS